MINNIKVSNEFINLPAKLDARGFDMIFFIANKLQNSNISDLNLISFTRKEIIEVLNLNKTISYKAIDKVISGILNNKIDYSSQDNAFVSFLIVEYNRDIEDMSVRITDKMAEFFLHLSKQYTIADLNVILKLKSIFSKRIYMMILQYRNLKKDRTIEVNEFKKILQVEGKYKTKQHLSNYILDIAKKEINSILPELKFNYKLDKDINKNLFITFTFDFSFIKELPQVEEISNKETQYTEEYKEPLKQEIQQEEPQPYIQKVSEHKKILNNLTVDDVYNWSIISGKYIDAEKFLAHYSAYNWIGSSGREIYNWKSLATTWALKQTDEEQKQAIDKFKEWEKEQQSKEIYERLLNAGVDNKKFAFQMQEKEMEHIFNFDKCRFVTEEELERDYTDDEKNFYKRWNYVLNMR